MVDQQLNNAKVAVISRFVRPGLFCIFVVCSFSLSHREVYAYQGETPTVVTESFSATDLEFFESKIRPLLFERCYECHSGSDLNGGLSVESRDSLLNGGDSGPALDLVSQPSVSLLLRAVEYREEHLKMPPDGRLSEQQIGWIKEWIERGAPDPRNPLGSEGNTTKSIKGLSLDEGKQFWSFKPLDNPSPPDVTDLSWVQTPVDNFILDRLGQQNLTPAGPADRRSLIRRLTLNLTGLPPTRDDVAAFEDDTSPTAYADLVERLLASPQYGVRWGKHWLDVARYADSNGLDENIAFGNAWRYRDYVVKAFNEDKSFRQFLIEQIAGDLVPYANEETKTATGFLALGARVLAEPDVEKLFMDTIDEQLDTLGKAFLGMSFGCARCHDHKFDPITQHDYYALAAILKGTRSFADERYGAIKYWYEHEFQPESDRERLTGVEAAIAAAKQAAASYKAQAYDRIRTAARSKAADYLAAAAQLPFGASLVQVEQVSQPLDLHPRILHYCRIHLENQKDSEFFSKWHELAGDSDAIQTHYETLFAEVDKAWQEAQAASPPSQGLSDPRLEQARLARLDAAGFLAIPPQPEYALDPESLEKYYDLMEEARKLESHAEDRYSAMGVNESVAVRTLPIHIRGSHLNLGRPVERGFPKVMQWSEIPPIFSRHASGRWELANWLADTSHPLTARVIVNRVWAWHFGRGLVGSTENFGVQGETPSHPELLDWLARRFVESGWSIKELNRWILLSSTYQMASVHEHASLYDLVDPENRLLWKFPIQRLDAEQLRDSVLVTCGRLDLKLDGKSVPLRNRQFVFDHTSIDHTRYDSLRRATYLPIIRNNLYTLLEQFDYPDPTMPTGTRNQTTVAPQSLLLMNNPLVLDSAEMFAEQVTKQYSENTIRLDVVFQALLGRAPSESESLSCLQYLSTVDESTSDRDEKRIWAGLIQALMATNDFLYVR
ncbi:PSD1 and planctomycete cytochrome C domain-containing protein [Pirellulaceae bacterium SH449]